MNSRKTCSVMGMSCLQDRHILCHFLFPFSNQCVSYLGQLCIDSLGVLLAVGKHCNQGFVAELQRIRYEWCCARGVSETCEVRAYLIEFSRRDGPGRCTGVDWTKGRFRVNSVSSASYDTAVTGLLALSSMRNPISDGCRADEGRSCSREGVSRTVHVEQSDGSDEQLTRLKCAHERV